MTRTAITLVICFDLITAGMGIGLTVLVRRDPRERLYFGIPAAVFAIAGFVGVFTLAGQRDREGS